MERLRFASYNTEWFNALFDDKDRMLADLEPSARFKVSRAEQLGALGIVFTALDADGVMMRATMQTSAGEATLALATQVRREQQDPVVFTVPASYRRLSPPPVAGAR